MQGLSTRYACEELPDQIVCEEGEGKGWSGVYEDPVI